MITPNVPRPMQQFNDINLLTDEWITPFMKEVYQTVINEYFLEENIPTLSDEVILTAVSNQYMLIREQYTEVPFDDGFIQPIAQLLKRMIMRDLSRNANPYVFDFGFVFKPFDELCEYMLNELLQ